MAGLRDRPVSDPATTSTWESVPVGGGWLKVIATQDALGQAHRTVPLTSRFAASRSETTGVQSRRGCGKWTPMLAAPGG